MNEGKNSNEQVTDTLGTDSIQNKLDSAAKFLDDARAEARARLAEERRSRAEAERAEKERLAKQESETRESEERIGAAMAKKRAESENAETYRHRFQFGKKRTRGDEANVSQLANDRKMRDEAAKREREELLRRNTEADSLLSAVNKQSDADNKVSECIPQGKTDATAKPTLLNAENQRVGQEVNFRAEEEAKLHAEKEAKLRAEEEAKLRAEEEAKLRAEEEAKLRAEKEAKLRAEKEAKLRAEEEAKLRAEKEAKLHAEKEAYKTNDNVPEIIIQDGIEFIRGIPEEPKNSAGKENVTIVDGIEFIRGIPEDDVAPSAKKSNVAENQSYGRLEINLAESHEGVKIIPQNESVCADTCEKATERPEKVESTSRSIDSILGSTYSMMTARTGLEEKYEKKREEAETAIRNSAPTATTGVKKAIPIEEPRMKYDYDAGYVVERGVTGDVKRKAKKEKPYTAPAYDVPTAAAMIIDDRSEKCDSVPESKVIINTDPIVATVKKEAPASSPIPDDQYSEGEHVSARLEALIEEKRNKELAVLILEEENKKELESLRESNRQARADYINAKYAAREEEYRKDIFALNARIRELEASRERSRAYYEASTDSYRTGAKDVAVAAYSSSSRQDEPYYEKDYTDSHAEDDIFVPIHIEEPDPESFEEVDEGKKRKSRKERKENKKSKAKEREQISDSEEYSRSDGRRAMLEDYKAYRDKYGEDSEESTYELSKNESKVEKLTDTDDKYPADRLTEDRESALGYVPEKNDDKNGSGYEGDHDIDVPVSKKRKFSDSDTLEAPPSDDEENALREHTEITVMKHRELKKHLAKTSKQEKKLQKAISRAERIYTRSSATEKPDRLISVMRAKKDLFILFTTNYMICRASEAKKPMRTFEKSTKRLAKDYNRNLLSYAKLTSQTQQTVPDPIEHIKKHNTPPSLPIPKRANDTTEVSERLSTRDMRKEQLALTRADTKERRKSARRARSDGSSVIKKQIANDNRTVEERIEYRINRYDYAMTKSKFRFGDQTGADKRERRKTLAKLKSMRSSRKSVIKTETLNNTRYLEVALSNAENVSLKRGADKERVKQIIERVGLLLTERDGINRRLDSLYRENEASFSSAKNTRKRITSIKLSVAKRAFKTQMKQYRKVSKYKIPSKDKLPLYNAMNDKIELAAYEAELRFRLKAEHPKGEAKRELKEHLRVSSKDLSKTERLIRKLRVALAKKNKVKNPKKNQLVWLAILIVLMVLCAVVYLFLKEEAAAVFNRFWDFCIGLFKKNG